MPVIKFNGSTNYNASDIARRAQGRAVFANSLVNQKTLDQACLNRVVSGPAAATSYSGQKIVDQRVGTVFTTAEQAAEIVLTSPCEVKPGPPPPIVYPNYVLECSDPAGIQIMATGTFTSFTFTTTSQGAGIIEFQFFLLGNYVSSRFIILDVDSNLITPPRDIDEVRYIFKCNPVNVELSCSPPSFVLQWTLPYSFTNTTGSTKTLSLTPYPTGPTTTVSVSNGDTYTPTPAWGWYSWSLSPCP